MWWSAQGYIGEMINESSLFLAFFLPHNILKHWFIVELNIEAVKGFGHAYPIRPGVGATALASAVRVEYDSVPMKLLNTVDDRVVQIMMMKRRRRKRVLRQMPRRKYVMMLLVSCHVTCFIVHFNIECFPSLSAV